MKLIFKSCCYLGAAFVALWPTVLPLLKMFRNFNLTKSKNRILLLLLTGVIAKTVLQITSHYSVTDPVYF